MKRLSRIALLSVLFAACSDAMPPVNNPPPEVVLRSIAVTSSRLMIAKSETSIFSATGTYSDSTSKVLTAVVWASSNTDVATISEAGVATAVAAGSTEITATSGAISGSATLTVIPAALVSLALEPTSATLAPAATRQLTATATFDDGSNADVTASVVWSSSNESAVTVAAGLVTAVAEGTAMISAKDAASNIESGDHSATITVRIEPPDSLVIAPEMATLARGLTLQLTATAHFADGSTSDVTSEVTWSSSSDANATVSPTGLVTAVNDGFASIRATHSSGVNASASIHVTPPEITSLAVRPNVATSNINVPVRFEAFAIYSDGVEREATTLVMWSSSAPSVSAISNMAGDIGTARPVALGTTTISVVHAATGVSSDNTGGSATLTVVAPTLLSVMIVPAQTSVPSGLDVHVDAFGLYSDNSGRNITSEVTWASSNDTLATVDANGNVTGHAIGSVTISATDPVTGISSNDSLSSCTVTIDPPILNSIEVMPPLVTMVEGSQQAFTAMGHFSDGNAQNINALVTWSVSPPGVITINAAGVATANALGGPVTVAARDPVTGISSNNTMQSASVLVANATLTSIAVTPMTSATPVGADLQFEATGTYSNMATVDLTTLVNWSSSDPTIASISSTGGIKGLASTLAPGQTQISATDPFSGISSPTVTLDVPAGVTLSAIDVNASSTEIDVNEQLPFTAQGTFSDLSVHPMTNSVSWSSSNAAIATISNTEGTRGLAVGVAEGMTTISATHVPTGISSNDSAQSFLLSVHPSIMTADVIHYELEEGSGAVATNLAPGQPNGTINGAVLWNSPGVAVGTSNFRLTIPTGGISNVNTNLPATTFTNLTIEFWWRFGTGLGLSYMWNSAQSFRAFTNGVAFSGIFVRQTPGGADVIYLPSVQDGNWHHIVYVLDAAAFQGRLYVDAAQVGTTTYSGSILLSSWFVLGQNSTAGADVDFDRYRVWSTAMTAAQVIEAFNGLR